jgi:hypothetical protein
MCRSGVTFQFCCLCSTSFHVHRQAGCFRYSEDKRYVILHYSNLLHSVHLTFGIFHASTCILGWCFLFSLLQILKYTTCLCSIGHLHVYSLVCGSFKVTYTSAGSSLQPRACSMLTFIGSRKKCENSTLKTVNTEHVDGGRMSIKFSRTSTFKVTASVI